MSEPTIASDVQQQQQVVQSESTTESSSEEASIGSLSDSPLVEATTSTESLPKKSHKKHRDRDKDRGERDGESRERRSRRDKEDGKTDKKRRSRSRSKSRERDKINSKHKSAGTSGSSVVNGVTTGSGLLKKQITIGNMSLTTENLEEAPINPYAVVRQVSITPRRNSVTSQGSVKVLFAEPNSKIMESKSTPPSTKPIELAAVLGAKASSDTLERTSPRDSNSPSPRDSNSLSPRRLPGFAAMVFFFFFL